MECFSCVYKHLAPEGAAIIDLISPDEMANRITGERVSIKKGINPDNGKMTEELNKKLFIDKEKQLVRVEHIYVEKNQDKSECINSFVQDYTYIAEN